MSDAPKPKPQHDPQQTLDHIRQKMESLAGDFAEGKINKDQFNAVYHHYAQQMEVVQKLIEKNPDSDAWKDTPLSGEQRRILKSYKDSVQGDGAVTVPVHRPGGKTGYVSWFSRDPGSLLRRYRDTWRDTYLISHAFITRVDALEGAARRREATAAADTLSLREIECLGWAARGKTEEDIGTILGRSRETVHFHLGNASRKLGASNRTHAVAIACALGLIHLF